MTYYSNYDKAAHRKCRRTTVSPIMVTLILIVGVMASIAVFIHMTSESYAGAQLSNKFDGGELYVLKTKLQDDTTLKVLLLNNGDKPATIGFVYILDSHGQVVSSGETDSDEGMIIEPGNMKFVTFTLDKPVSKGEYIVQIMSYEMGSGFSSLKCG